jgi:hypothetical protein
VFSQGSCGQNVWDPPNSLIEIVTIKATVLQGGSFGR